MTIKSMLLSRRAAKEDFSTCTDDYSEAYTDNGEPNAIEKFLYDALDAVEDYSTDTDISEAYDDAIAGEPKVTFKSKLLGRRAACTSVRANTVSPEACNDTSAGEPNAIENFFNNASSQVATIFSEAACMADDMRTIITTDIDEESVDEAQDEKKSTVQPAKTAIKVNDNPSPAISAKPMKETSPCETQEYEPHEGQPTNSGMKMKGSPSTLAKLMTKLDKKEKPKQPTSSTMEVKGSPATLAKLMMKLDQKEKQIEKLKQQRNKTEQEVVETKKSIRALAVKFRGVLGDEEDDDDQTEYDESVWEDEERDDDAVELANWYASQL